MTTILRSTVVALAAVLVAAAPASAQAERPQREYRGLFGGPAPRPDSQTELDANVSLVGAYDDNLGQAQGENVDPRHAVAGTYSGIDAGLTYTHTGHHLDFALTGGSSARYYSTLHSLTSVGDQAAVSVGMHGRRASFRVIESGSYSPLLMLAPFVGPEPSSAAEIASAPTNTAVQRDTMLGSSTSVTGDVKLGPRWSLESTDGFDTSTVRYDTGSTHQQSWEAGGRLQHQVSSASAFHLGYTEQQLKAEGDAPSVHVHNVDLGMDVHKALGRTRKTTMSVSFGSGMIQDGTANLYSVLVDASLNREIARSWVATANYHRGVGMVSGFSRPLFADSFNASAGGLMTRRIDLRVNASYTNGEIGITGLTNTFTGYNASTRVRYAFTEMYAVYAEYVAYWYDLNNNLYVATPLPSNVLRQGVHIGLTLWLPLIR